MEGGRGRGLCPGCGLGRAAPPNPAPSQSLQSLSWGRVGSPAGTKLQSGWKETCFCKRAIVQGLKHAVSWREPRQPLWWVRGQQEDCYGLHPLGVLLQAGGELGLEGE